MHYVLDLQTKSILQSKVTKKWLSSRQKPSLEEIAVTDPASDIKDTLEDQQPPSDNTAPNSPASNATVESPSGQPSPINEPETQDSPSSLPAGVNTIEHFLVSTL